MDKFIEILKELFELVRGLVVGLVQALVPVVRALWAWGRKACAFVAEYAGPTARFVWAYLGPILKWLSVPFAWLGVRIWRFIGPSVKTGGKWTWKYICIGGRWTGSRVSMTPVLRRREKRLLMEQLGDEEAAWLVRSRTKVDVGLWFRKRKVWCCLARQRLLLLAAGKTSVVENVPVDDLKKTRYNHITGELILSPAEGARIRCLRMPPLDAFELLSQIRDDEDIESWSISLDEHLDDLDRAEDSGAVMRTMDGLGDVAPAK